METLDLNIFPGGDLVMKGLADLAGGVSSDEAVLVMIAGPRLRGMGFTFPDLAGISKPYEHALYASMEDQHPVGAHSVYNGLIHRMVSFADAYDHHITLQAKG